MTCSMSKQKTETEQLFAHLHRGGRYAHLWTDHGHRSYWFPVGEAASVRRQVPHGWLAGNVYFSVNPLSAIPPHNMSGGTDPRYICSQLVYIAAINTLYAEYDGKDFVRARECQALLPHGNVSKGGAEQRRLIRSTRERIFYRAPGHFKKRILRQISGLLFPPNVIVDSGGGYHCYWLLRDSIPVDEGNLGDIQMLQHGWVEMVGADVGASDLRRLLRVPGTFNRKPGFGQSAPRVFFLRSDFDQGYAYDRLEERVNDWLYENRGQSLERWQTPRRKWPSRGLRVAFNRQHRIVDLLQKRGYRSCFLSDTLIRMARPGRPRNRSSVTIFPAQEDGTPELSVHFSSNDELFSECYVDRASGRLRRHAHDAFYIYVCLEHRGDWRAAYAAAAESNK